MDNPLFAIKFFTNQDRTEFSAHPVIKGRMYWLPYQSSFKLAYKKAMSFIRLVRREGDKVLKYSIKL